MLERKEQMNMELVERVVLHGDLSKLTATERVAYYRAVCQSLGLNPLTRPFEYIQLQGRLTLYARRDATDQLRRLHRVSVQIISREMVNGVYVVVARAVLPDGRADEAIGAVAIDGLKGDALANAIMKAETKAKRRVTLSIVGLGWLDETEIAGIGQPVEIDDEVIDVSAQEPEPQQQEEQERPERPEEQEDQEVFWKRVRAALIKRQLNKETQEALLGYWRDSNAGKQEIAADLRKIDANKSLWADRLRAFWARAKEVGLTTSQVHEKLGVATIYLLTPDEAFEKLEEQRES